MWSFPEIGVPEVIHFSLRILPNKNQTIFGYFQHSIILVGSFMGIPLLNYYQYPQYR